MTTLTQTFSPNLTRIARTRRRDEVIERLIPRPCMVYSLSLLLAGLVIPLLMAIGVLQPDLALGFLGFALTITGGTLVFVFCGNI